MPSSTLLDPLVLGPHTARNRLWLPPMCMYSAQDDGQVTPWHVIHYASRAVGGFGTVVVEATAATRDGRLSPRDLGLWDDGQVAGHRRITEAVHAAGALAAVQIGHGGRKAGTPPWRPTPQGSVPQEARTATIEGWDLVGPSPLAYPQHAEPREMSVEEVGQVVAAFGQAARRAVEAGYDLIELHGAHGYLIHQFLSPLSNKRSDDYGGSPQGRRRFLLEVVQAVLAEITDRAALGVRLSATDWLEGGLEVQDTAELCRELVAAGVTALHISSGGNMPARIPLGPGYQAGLAAQVREAVADLRTPQGYEPVVVTVGGIENGPQAEQILRTGQADAVAVGRAALRDPYTPLRWAHELGVDDWQEAGFPEQYWRGTWR